MKTGLVLGAGGVVGASWIVGALEALSSETGWDPSRAERIVGTSAGAVIGCLVADGIPPAYMSAYTAGRRLDEFAELERRTGLLGERPDGSSYRVHPGLPRVGPGSLRLAVSTLTHARRRPLSIVLAGWLPQGFISTQPIERVIDAFVEDEWPRHDAFWAVAADYRSGKRVAFGRAGAPAATAAQAVAASCAIPGFYRPVEVAGRCYVDGGVCSPSNLDLIRDEDLDLAVCLNPMSSPAPSPGGSPGDRLGAIMRRAARSRLEHEIRKLTEAGIEVLVLEPTARDLAVMGWNPIARNVRLQVAEMATRTTAVQLRALRETEQTLPGPSPAGKRGTPRRQALVTRQAA